MKVADFYDVSVADRMRVGSYCCLAQLDHVNSTASRDKSTNDVSHGAVRYTWSMAPQGAKRQTKKVNLAQRLLKPRAGRLYTCQLPFKRNSYFLISTIIISLFENRTAETNFGSLSILFDYVQCHKDTDNDSNVDYLQNIGADVFQQ